MAIATLPANQAKLTFKVAGQHYPVISMLGIEAISAGFTYSIEALFSSSSAIEALIKNKAQLSIIGQDGIQRNVYGVIIKAEGNNHYNKDLSRIKITLVSHLNLLKNTRDTRIILGLSVVEIIKQTCERNSIDAHQIKFSLVQAYPGHAFTLQADETDWDFVQRLMSHAGIYCYSSVNEDPDHANYETIVFTDNNTYCPYIVRNVLQYIPRSNQTETIYGKAQVGIYHLSATHNKTTERFTIHDRNLDTPEVQILATTDSPNYKEKKHSKPTEQTRFGLGASSFEQAAQLARFEAEHAQVKSFCLNTKANVVDMAAGYVCSVDASRFNQKYSGDYLITQVTHSANQSAGFNLDDALIAYRSDAKCILRSTQYRGGLVAHPETPMTFTARVESNGPYAQLDEQGRYKVRPHFDRPNERGTTEHTQASAPLRRMQSFGGMPSQDDKPTGWHTPLQDDAEVLLSCLNGDPSRPIIVGTLPNPDNHSPVTSVNRTQNIIRTQSGNELCMDDKIDKEAITLSTFNGENILHLDANAMGHKIRLATEHGAMHLFAKKTISTKTNDSLIERSGNNRTQIVENAYKLKTRKKEIHHQAKTDIRHTAHLNIKTKSRKNTELKTAKDLKINVDQNASLTIKGSKGLFVNVQNNNVTINAAKNINIKGQGGGDITFEQSGGGFKIDASGIVNLYGNKVSIAGSPVSLNGNVSYNISAPNIPAAASTEAPLIFAGIHKLKDDNEPQVINLAWDKKIIPIGELATLKYTAQNYQGGEAVTITVYEKDSDGTKTQIDTIQSTLDDGFGHYEHQWARTEEQTQQDLLDDNHQHDLEPLSYVFDVTINSEVSKLSKTLHMSSSVEFEALYPDGSPVADDTKVVLIDAMDKKHRTRIKNGIASFNNVALGQIAIDIAGEPINTVSQ